jgi:hypothetical protein
MLTVCIPSYGRANVIQSKTLAVLRLGCIPVSDVIIFCVAEEEQAYRQTCPEYRITVGPLGLINQRKYIQSTLMAGSYIVMMDDDIEDIYQAGYDEMDELYRPIKKPILNLNDLFYRMIRTMIDQNVTICGICPHSNLKFALSSPEISTNLKYIVGAFYIIKNELNDKTQPTCIDSLEDRERTVLYYLKERKTVRFNWIQIKTKYFGKGGLESPDRLIQHSMGSRGLALKYPNMIRLKIVKNLVDAKIRTGKKQVMD